MRQLYEYYYKELSKAIKYGDPSYDPERHIKKQSSTQKKAYLPLEVGDARFVFVDETIARPTLFNPCTPSSMGGTSTTVAPSGPLKVNFRQQKLHNFLE